MCIWYSVTEADAYARPHRKDTKNHQEYKE